MVAMSANVRRELRQWHSEHEQRKRGQNTRHREDEKNIEMEMRDFDMRQS